MKREYAGWIIILAGLLLIGFLIGRSTSMPQLHPADTFRAWLWEHRSLDLLVQVGLIFAGALGVVAVLPRHKDDYEKANE